MKPDHLLAVVSASDLDASRDWYARLLDRAPDNDPMPSLTEWRVTDTGWLQVHVDAERAGTSQVNLAVADLDAEVEALAARGIAGGVIQEVSKGVRLAALRDPDGNEVTLLGSFREVY